MKEAMKSKTLAVAVILTVGACFMAVSANRTAAKTQQSLDQERYNRMVAEEKLNETSSRAAFLQTELDSAKAKIQSIQAVLDEGKSTNSDLQAQLDSVTKLKESLERKMEEMKAPLDSSAKTQ